MCTRSLEYIHVLVPGNIKLYMYVTLHVDFDLADVAPAAARTRPRRFGTAGTQIWMAGEAGSSATYQEYVY